jgi:hypothetical protein
MNPTGLQVLWKLTEHVRFPVSDTLLRAFQGLDRRKNKLFSSQDTSRVELSSRLSGGSNRWLLKNESEISFSPVSYGYCQRVKRADLSAL